MRATKINDNSGDATILNSTDVLDDIPGLFDYCHDENSSNTNHQTLNQTFSGTISFPGCNEETKVITKAEYQKFMNDMVELAKLRVKIASMEKTLKEKSDKIIRLQQKVEPITGIEFPENIVNSINMKQIAEKDYKSVVDLRNDIEWFAHHIRSKVANSKPSVQKQIVNAAKWLVSQFYQELNNLLLCNECYENAYKSPDVSATMPCTPPHLLLWTQAEGWGCWPAKMLKCNIDEDLEVNKYIENMKKVHGNFNFAADDTPFDPDKLGEHIKFMIKSNVTSTSPGNAHRQEVPEDHIVEELTTDESHKGLAETESAEHGKNVTTTIEKVVHTKTVNASKNEMPGGNQSSLKRPSSSDTPTSLVGDNDTKKTTNQKLEGEKHAALESLAKVEAENKHIEVYIKDLENDIQDAVATSEKLKAEKDAALKEVDTLKEQLASEKARNKNACIICGKECLMFCGPGCLNERLKQKPSDN
ncbi:zinc finger MYND domain-containing protein 11-like [Sitodiplosis mosellana]|uniref:zinc finger MYND domain-containing protein 11-like n=1 Tax=Sitodiplosis mosellana TaxID=263140 RepID=UPI002444EFCF|nr:zinc finger MYND domain-containing protein 11-like [Sitodiplosis mosellana]